MRAPLRWVGVRAANWQSERVARVKQSDTQREWNVARRLSPTMGSATTECVACAPKSQLEAEGAEFDSRTARLLATKKPSNRANQPGHRTSPGNGFRCAQPILQAEPGDQNASHACTGRLLPWLTIISNGDNGARLAAAAAPVVSIAAFGSVGANLQPATIIIVAATLHITATRVIFRIANLLILSASPGAPGGARSVPYS